MSFRSLQTVALLVTRNVRVKITIKTRFSLEYLKCKKRRSLFKDDVAQRELNPNGTFHALPYPWRLGRFVGSRAVVYTFVFSLSGRRDHFVRFAFTSIVRVTTDRSRTVRISRLNLFPIAVRPITSNTLCRLSCFWFFISIVQKVRECCHISVFSLREGFNSSFFGAVARVSACIFERSRGRNQLNVG